jgi:transposase
MSESAYTEGMSPKDLTAENKWLKAENAALKKRLAELEKLVAQLQEQLQAAQRAGKRQATPFSKGEPKARPQTPGRKAGHPATHRPLPDKVDQIEEAALVPVCPACGGQVLEGEVQAQYQIDIPRPIPVRVTQFNIHIGHCESCGRRVQGRHPAQTSDATGAAAVQIGPNALGWAAELKHVMGLPYGKTAQVLSTATDLKVQRSTLARASQRLAAKCQPTYGRLILRLRHSAVAHVDETGWKVGGHLAWLWVFANDEVSVYVIDPSRAHEVVEAILGQDYQGVLVSDCFLAYDPLTCSQSKCVAHLLRRCKELQEVKSGRAVQFSQDLTRVLQTAITLKGRQTQMSAHGYQVACGRLEASLDRLLERQLTDADNARFAKTLRKQRPRLLTFLYHHAVSPTNNLAERELRPAVIVRKTGGCNRSPSGAQAHAILASVLRTCQKQGFDPVEVLKQLLQKAEAMIIDLVAPPKKKAASPSALAPP